MPPLLSSLLCLPHSFHTHTFAYPESTAEREEILHGLQGRILDIRTVRHWEKEERKCHTHTHKVSFFTVIAFFSSLLLLFFFLFVPPIPLASISASLCVSSFGSTFTCLLWDQVLSQTEQYLQQLLGRALAELPRWRVRVAKCKAVQMVLNLCSPSVTDKCLIAEAWCPIAKLLLLQSALVEGTVREEKGLAREWGGRGTVDRQDQKGDKGQR